MDLSTLELAEDGTVVWPPSAVPTREQIEAFAQYLLSFEPEHGITVLSTDDYFAPNLYGRVGHLPKGAYAVGAAHLQGHLNVCFGDITVWTEEGMKRLTGFNILVSEPGCMRVGFAHEDTTWLAIHANPTDTRDVVELENSLVESPERLSYRRQALLQAQAQEHLA